MIDNLKPHAARRISAHVIDLAGTPVRDLVTSFDLLLHALEGMPQDLVQAEPAAATSDEPPADPDTSVSTPPSPVVIQALQPLLPPVSQTPSAPAAEQAAGCGPEPRQWRMGGKPQSAVEPQVAVEGRDSPGLEQAWSAPKGPEGRGRTPEVHRRASPSCPRPEHFGETMSWSAGGKLEATSTTMMPDGEQNPDHHPAPWPAPIPASATPGIPLPITKQTSEQPAAQQLLAAIRAPLQATAAGATSSFPASDEIKVLRIRLKPDALGEVDVTLRRNGSRMNIDIMVSKSLAAEALHGDLGMLQDRVAALLGSEDRHHIKVTLHQSEPFLSPASSGSGMQGGQPSGGGDRQTPRKQDGPTHMARNDRHEPDGPLQPVSTGLVV